MIVRRWLVLSLAASTAVAAACSSIDEPPPYPVGEAPDAGKAPGTDAATKPPVNPPPPPPVAANPACTPATPDMDQQCTIMGQPTMQGTINDVWVANTASGCPDVYVAYKFTGSVPDKLYRFKMKKATPCTFDLDATMTSLNGSTQYDQIAADDAGNVYVVSFGNVERVLPGIPVRCTKDAAIAGLIVDMAISPDGKTGYVTYTVSGSTQPAFGKLVTSASACSVVPMAVSGVTTPFLSNRVVGIAIDAKGRLHVGDSTATATDQSRVVIFDATGAFVSEYKPATGIFGVNSLTRCRTGMCIDGLDTIAGVSDDGAPRAARKTSAGGGYFPGIHATVAGLIFDVGGGAGDAGAPNGDAIVIARLADL
jgi:hypothetical protein